MWLDLWKRRDILKKQNIKVIKLLHSEFWRSLLHKSLRVKKSETAGCHHTVRWSTLEKPWGLSSTLSWLMVQSSNKHQGSVVSVGTWHRPNMQNKERQTGKAVFWLSVFYLGASWSVLLSGSSQPYLSDGLWTQRFRFQRRILKLTPTVCFRIIF